MCVRRSIARVMQLIRSGSFKKHLTFSSIVKNASFSRGWLHLAVQCLFAVITVTSFILIVTMAIPTVPEVQPVPERESRCYSKNCIVYCEGVPYFGQYKEDIVYTVSELQNICSGFYLSLRNATFSNQTLETSSFPRMRLPIYELAFIGGNLNHLPTEAFLNQNVATVKVLLFQGLTIKTWSADSLVGLSSLKALYIKESSIVNVKQFVLMPIHDTLETLTMMNNNHWDPNHFTGQLQLQHLTVVDFSNNMFHDVLNKNSFRGLEQCKTLYLNSCKITSIGAGTFDNLHSIETLFLNNNLLVTLPPGLFNNILSITLVKPRINLQDNLWYCDCSVKYIRALVAEDMLLTDPICNAPKPHKGRSFFEFESYCDDDPSIMATTENSDIPKPGSIEISGVVYVNNGCYNDKGNSSNGTLKVMSPVIEYKCLENSIYKSNFQVMASRSRNEEVSFNDWIKFSFFITTGPLSVVQITSSEENKYGVLWYQSTCPNEVYCVNIFPNNLRVYNVDFEAQYVFCPVLQKSGQVKMDKCVNYDLSKMKHTALENKLSILFYISTGGICLVVGALCVYALVRRHPNLLKGSKRILFVKHKNVEALVLPPKVPIRNDFRNEHSLDFNEKKIFVVPANSFDAIKFKRSKSTRSSKSNAPSYISALQPTEDQLAEWRVQNHLTNDPTSDLSVYSWICNADPFLYTEIIDYDKIYESLK